MLGKTRREARRALAQDHRHSKEKLIWGLFSPTRNSEATKSQTQGGSKEGKSTREPGLCFDSRCDLGSP